MQEENKIQISKSEEEQNIQTSDSSILFKIFYSSPNDPLTLSPIIKSTDELPHLFYLLKNPKILNFKEKFEILQKLMPLFKSNTNLINLFAKRCKSNTTSWYEPIIDLYFEQNEDNSDDNKKFLEEMLVYMVNISSIPKFMMEYIYQKLSIYLRYNTEKEKIPELKKGQFMKYLNLLEIFYTNSLENDIMDLYDIHKKEEGEEEPINENVITTNYFEGEKIKEIKNYLFFNGVNSKITIFLNENSNNINCDFPTMQSGFSFVFWINLEENLIKEYYTVNEGKNVNKIMTLISLMFGENQIRVQLINEKNLLVIFDDIESDPIDISKSFKYGSWNNICIIIENKKLI